MAFGELLPRYLIIEPFVKQSTILEIGTLDIRGLQMLVDYGAASVTGTYTEALQSPKGLEVNPRVSLIHVPDGSLPFSNNTFDILLVTDLSTELEKNPSFVTEAKRILKQNGIVLFAYPAVECSLDSHLIQQLHVLITQQFSTPKIFLQRPFVGVSLLRHQQGERFDVKYNSDSSGIATHILALCGAETSETLGTQLLEISLYELGQGKELIERADLDLVRLRKILRYSRKHLEDLRSALNTLGTSAKYTQQQNTENSPVDDELVAGGSSSIEDGVESSRGSLAQRMDLDDVAKEPTNKRKFESAFFDEYSSQDLPELKSVETYDEESVSQWQQERVSSLELDLAKRSLEVEVLSVQRDIEVEQLKAQFDQQQSLCAELQARIQELELLASEERLQIDDRVRPNYDRVAELEYLLSKSRQAALDNGISSRAHELTTHRLAEELEKLQGKVESLQQERDALSNTSNHLLREREKNLQEMGQLQQDYERECQARSLAEKSIEYLTSQAQEDRLRVSSSTRLIQRVDELFEQLQQKSIRCEELEEQSNKLRKNIRQFDLQLAECQKNTNETKQYLQVERLKAADREHEVQELICVVSQLRRDKESLERRLEEQSNTLLESETHLTEMLAHNSRLQAERAQIKQEYLVVQADLAQVRVDLSYQNTQQKSIESLLEDALESHSCIEDQYNEALALLEESEKDLQTALQEKDQTFELLSSTTDELEKLKDEKELTFQTLSAAQQQLQISDEAKNEALGTLNTAKEELQVLEQKHTKAVQENTELKSTILGQTETIKRFQRALTEQEADYQRVSALRYSRDEKSWRAILKDPEVLSYAQVIGQPIAKVRKLTVLDGSFRNYPDVVQNKAGFEQKMQQVMASDPEEQALQRVRGWPKPNLTPSTNLSHTTFVRQIVAPSNAYMQWLVASEELALGGKLKDQVIEKAKQEVQHQKSLIHGLENELLTLKEELQLSNNFKDNFRSEIEQLQTCLLQAQQEIDAQKQQQVVLKDSFVRQKSVSDEHVAENSRLENDIHFFQRQTDDLRRRAETAEMALAATKSEVVQLSQKMEHAKQQSDARLRQFEVSEQARERLKGIVDEEKTLVVDLQDSLRNLRQESLELRQRAEKAEGRLAAAVGEANLAKEKQVNLQQELSRIQAVSANAISTLDSAERAKMSAIQSEQRVRNQMLSQEVTVDSLRQKVKALETELSLVQADANEVSAAEQSEQEILRLSSVFEEADGVMRRLEELEQSLAESALKEESLRNQLKSAEDKLHEAQHLITQYQKTQAFVVSQEAENKADNGELKVQLHQAHSRAVELEQRMADFEEAAQARWAQREALFSRQLQALVAERFKLQGLVQSAEQGQMRLQTRVQDLEQALAEADEENRQLIYQLTRVQSEGVMKSAVDD